MTTTALHHSWLPDYRAAAPIATPFGASVSLANVQATAIVGATIIDGTGAAPLADATVVLAGHSITAVGPRRAVRVPTAAEVVDGRGLFVLPGFVDAGVRLTAVKDSVRCSAGSHDSSGVTPAVLDSLVTSRAIAALHSGVTTVRDFHGSARVLRRLRERLRAGQPPAARVLIAGCVTGTHPDSAKNVFGWERYADARLVTATAESLGILVGRALDQEQPDFVQYSGTLADFAGNRQNHEAMAPPVLLFEERGQRAIVEQAHRHGLSVTAHAATPEALRLALLAGADVIEHPELLWNGAVLSDALARFVVQHGAICALMPQISSVAGTSYWLNAKKLIRAGCPVAVMTGRANPGGDMPEAIEGLIALGLSPMEALVAATRRGAQTAHLVDRIGTVEPGKWADLVVLRADPLRDIQNVRQVAMVFIEGRRVTLPPPAEPGVADGH